MVKAIAIVLALFLAAGCDEVGNRVAPLSACPLPGFGGTATYPCVAGRIAIATPTVINMPVANTCSIVNGCPQGDPYRFGTTQTSGGYTYFLRVVASGDCRYTDYQASQAAYDSWSVRDLDPLQPWTCDW